MDEIMKYLNEDRLLHMDMLEPLRLGTAQLIAGSGDGALIYMNEAQTYLMSARNPQAAQELASHITQGMLVCLHQPWQADELALRLHLPKRMICHQAVMLHEARPLKVPQGFELRLLTLDNLQDVMAHYENADGDSEYITGRILAGMLGAFYGHELAGFIGCHAEGSMGILEVLPLYQRRGLAKTLQSHWMAHLIAQGKIPYGQVVKGNTASVALQKSLGMTLTTTAPIIWLIGQEA